DDRLILPRCATADGDPSRTTPRDARVDPPGEAPREPAREAGQDERARDVGRPVLAPVEARETVEQREERGDEPDPARREEEDRRDDAAGDRVRGRKGRLGRN